MEQQTGVQDSVEFKSALFSANIKGKDIQLRDLILLATFVLCVCSAGLWWLHREDGKDSQVALATVLQELVKTHKEGVTVQKETACMLRFGQEKREGVVEFCKQLAR
jgi:hypothetical protein